MNIFFILVPDCSLFHFVGLNIEVAKICECKLHFVKTIFFIQYTNFFMYTNFIVFLRGSLDCNL